MKGIVKILKLIIILFTLLFFLNTVPYFVYPDISKLKDENPQKTSFMEYREREVDRKKIKVKQVWIPFSKISPYLVGAVVIAEDNKFWSHKGFDFESIQKAMKKNFKQKIKFGGSTISQQLAKNLYCHPSKNLVRKIKEAILTWRIERSISKERILELYLNVIELGDGIFGVEAASRYYFNKPASEIDPIEAARLASIIPNPRRYNPVESSKYVEKRSMIIYNAMIGRDLL